MTNPVEHPDRDVDDVAWMATWDRFVAALDARRRKRWVT
jgi:hypothetical protein